MKTKPEKVPRISSLIDMFCLCRCVGKKSAEASSLPLNTAAANGPLGLHGPGSAPVIRKPPSRRADMAEGGGQLYACDICGQEGLTEDDMRSHVLIEHVEGAVSCPFCDLEGTTVEEMNMHVNHEHLDFLTPTQELGLGVEDVDEDSGGGGRLVGHSASCVSDIQNCNGFSDGSGSGSSDCAVPTAQSSDSVSVSGLSSSDTTPEGGGISGYSDQPLSPPPVPMEITITSADSPKRTLPAQPAAEASSVTPDIGIVKTKAGTPPDGEEQLRKRAKLYLDVPPVARPQQQQQQHLCKTTNNCNNCSTETLAAAGGLGAGATAMRIDNANEGEGGMLEEDGDGEEKKDAEKPYTEPPRNAAANRTASKMVTPTKDKGSPLQCPLCEWSTKSPGEIMRHVNAEHLDILSPLSAKARANNQAPQQVLQRTDTENNVIGSDRPSTSTATTKNQQQEPPQQPTNQDQQFECPICGHLSRSGSTLELHVNSRHADILSPGGVGVAHSSSSNGVGIGGGGLGQTLQSPMSIGSSTDSSMCCPMCGMEFADTHDLAIHVDGHFSAEHTPVTEQMDNLLAQELERRERAAYKMQEQREFEKLQELYGMNGKSNYRKQAERNLERAVCHGQMSISDYYTRKQEIQQASIAGIDDGHSCTGDIMGRLRQYYKVTQSNVANAWLCSGCDHFAASYGDKGWGCGYRNLQMMLSCLSTNPTYEQILFNVDLNEGGPMIPSIPKIQRLIEAAWQKGFDLQGCEQLGGKVVDTTKWIGATEIVATLSSLKVKCQLIDFHAPTGKDGTHPRLFEWVRDYFKKDTDFKSPLYLQHQGHSRTIVGVEQLKDGQLRLLLFDPSCSRKQMHQFVHGEITANLMRCLRRSLHSMKAKQYQIVAVAGILTEQEFEESKVMKSDRIP